MRADKADMEHFGPVIGSNQKAALGRAANEIVGEAIDRGAQVRFARFALAALASVVNRSWPSDLFPAKLPHLRRNVEPCVWAAPIATLDHEALSDSSGNEDTVS
jgi:hypothetical protein